MRIVWAIACREIYSSLVTPLAYVLAGAFMAVSGFFFFGSLQFFNTIVRQAAMNPELNPNYNIEVVEPFYQTIQVILVFLIPILTMRSFAEERQIGTFEMLSTSPVTIAELVLGKFLGFFIILLAMLVLSFVYPLSLIIFADPEILPVFIGFLGLILFSSSFLSLGIAISSTTKSQTIAGVLSLVLMLMFFLINQSASKVSPDIGNVLDYLSPITHTEVIFKGLLTGSDIVYFLSLSAFGLFATNRVLESKAGG